MVKWKTFLDIYLIAYHSSALSTAKEAIFLFNIFSRVNMFEENL